MSVQAVYLVHLYNFCVVVMPRGVYKITFALLFINSFCFAEFRGVADWLCACVEEREGVCCMGGVKLCAAT